MAGPLARMAAVARRSLGPLAHRLHLTGRYRGHIDGYAGHELCGWVVESRSHAGGLEIGLFVGDALMQTQRAARFRADVQSAGLGDGACGFALRLEAATLAAAQKANGLISLQVLGHKPFRIGRYQLPPAEAAGLVLSDRQIALCRQALAGDIAALRDLVDKAEVVPQLSADAQPALTPHKKLFSRPPSLARADTAGALPAYLDHVRHRQRQERAFDIPGNPEDRDHFLHWYLSTYSAGRQGLRVPLSAEVVSYLTEPVVMGGQAHSLSRAMWWRICRSPERLARLDLQSHEGLMDLLFWWAWQEAPALHAEDCLVTPRQVDLLAAIPATHQGGAFGLSAFLRAFHATYQPLQFLDTKRAEDRQIIHLAVIVMAARRPDLLRYVPRNTIERLIERPSAAPSLLDVFLQQLAADAGFAQGLSAETLEAALRLKGYSLARQGFLSLTAAGDRLEAARLPVPAADAPFDVQLIGPISRTSGLGQATRLCADILALTGLRVNVVDFSFDNPSPDADARQGATAGFRPAHINLIHLNAEFVPLAFAYAPDVFSGAHNIGFVYWELDKPVACQQLGMDLLDEIWLASDFGIAAVKPGMGDKPVIKIGACCPALQRPDKARARASVDARLGLSGREFLCLMAFDSFSFAQRKNPLGAIEAFQRAFPSGEADSSSPQARLILKTLNRDHVADPETTRLWARIHALVARDPRILVINDLLDPASLAELKAGVDCYISLHRSEGWGFNMIEAMELGVPVLCTAYSGNLEFCTAETAWLVSARQMALSPTDYLYVPEGSTWADPDLDEAARQLRAIHDDPAARALRCAEALRNVTENFSPQAVALRYEARLRQILSSR